ncbi:MAG: transketolase [Patescibacteria group bacterium]|nr:transketolase [Patescibacteria group bacterium]MDD5715401.1 transketolase [Patescibacteria group bacterium]
MKKKTDLKALTALIRSWILRSTTAAGSGHPTSSLSAVELMAGLMFGGTFKFETKNPGNPNNDRLVFSKGHASPLFYSLWAAAGAVTEQELMSLRKFSSRLEGHPVMAFPFTEAATGSLGQGLSVGVGLALNAKYLDKLPYRTYVLLGDSEMAEGQVWEAIQLAAHYKLDNLVGIVDVNRWGQRGETMYGHKVAEYEKRVKAFGWQTIVVDGHAMPKVLAAFKKATTVKGKPVMIIGKTLKGKGVKLFENKDGWHGKPLPKEELDKALKGLGKIDPSVRGTIEPPKVGKPAPLPAGKVESMPLDKPIATRKAFGYALTRLGNQYPIVSLDAETSNSTYADIFQKAFPKRFFEMYIAEQNMAGTAVGIARRGKVVFASSFAAFLTRAYDQFRMGNYSRANIKVVGSHAGVSIGQDGVSQMGLEDLAMFRTLIDSVVLYPCDAVSCDKLVEQAVKHRGLVYIRTTRAETPVIYNQNEQFQIGGSKTLRSSNNDVATVVTAGITVFEALKAYDELKKQGVNIRVIDLYSVKPVDVSTLQKAAKETKAIITVEDHYPQGGLGEAVLSALRHAKAHVVKLAITKMPKSGKPGELLEYEGISAGSIVNAVLKTLGL